MAWAATSAWNAHAQNNTHSQWDHALPALQLKSSPKLQETLDASLRDQLPSYIKAEQISGQADLNATLNGEAELRRGDTVIRADRVEYDVANDTVNAQGDVHINSSGDIYQGTALKLQVDAFQGNFNDATYSSCKPRGTEMLSA